MGRIVNKTKKKELANNCLICRSMWTKARGLMFRRRKYVEAHSLVFDFDTEDRRSLHMMFVFYPIDIIFLNSAQRVVETCEELKPFCMCFPKKNAKYIIELPSGTISNSGTRIGDEVEWH